MKELMAATRRQKKDVRVLSSSIFAMQPWMDLQELETALTRIIASIEVKDYDKLLKADRDFHLVIGKATTNSILEQMLTFLLDVMEQGLWPRMKKGLLAASKKHLAETRRSHQGIYEAIKERNNEKAVEVMETHFDEIERLFH